jgi:hypothetical protein
MRVNAVMPTTGRTLDSIISRSSVTFCSVWGVIIHARPRLNNFTAVLIGRVARSVLGQSCLFSLPGVAGLIPI